MIPTETMHNIRSNTPDIFHFEKQFREMVHEVQRNKVVRTFHTFWCNILSAVNVETCFQSYIYVCVCVCVYVSLLDGIGEIRKGVSFNSRATLFERIAFTK